VVDLELHDAVEHVLLPLAMREGLDATAVDALCEVVVRRARDTAHQETDREDHCSFAVDLQPAMENCLALYSEEAALQIWGAIDRITGLIREWLNSDTEHSAVAAGQRTQRAPRQTSGCRRRPGDGVVEALDVHAPALVASSRE
jgi:hypothetical protein